MGFLGRVRSFFAGVSLVGFYLFAIGFFFFVAAFVKGVQVLVFVPALFLWIFLFSYFESERIRKTMGFSLERDKESYRIFVHSPKPVGLSFRVAFVDASGKFSYAEPDPVTMAVPYPESWAASVRLYYRGSFDLFRKTVDLWPLPPEGSLVSDSEALAVDSYSVSRRVQAGDFALRIDAFRSSSSDVPYVKSWETSKENVAAMRPWTPREISVRSTVPLTLPRLSDKARSLEWKLVALCSWIMALQWESVSFAAYLAGTFALFYALKNPVGIPKLSKSVKTFATFVCFVAMGWVSLREFDLMGPVSVFLLQILIIHYFYPDDRDESFLYIFLSLFVFATVSFLSIGVWFLLFFAVLLFLVLRLLFLSSGYLGRDSTSLPFKTEVPSGYLVKSFAALYLATFAFFAILPHGDGYRWGMSIPTPVDSDSATSGLKDEIALGGLLSLKRDSSKKIVVKDVSQEVVKFFAKAYWKGERFTTFDGTRWKPRPDGEYRYFQNSKLPEDALSLTYYDPGSKMVPLPMPADKVFVARSSRNAGFVQRIGDPYVHRTAEPMGSAYEVSLTFAESLPEIASFSGTDGPLDASVETLFRKYWEGISPDVSSDPVKLAKYVRDGSGFGYSVENPAKDLESFLYGEKRGHCEYFATVLAVTMRHFGYPATVVNGYYSWEYSRFSDTWIIRGEQAHAWVEVLENGRWTIYDPTPNSWAVTKSPVDEWKALAVSAYDSVDLFWFTYVVGYSWTAQRDLARSLASAWRIWLSSALALAFGYFAFRYVRERVRRSHLSPKERFIEWLSEASGEPFPLSVYEKTHGGLVLKTRLAAYGRSGLGKEGFDALSKEWESVFKKKR